MDVLSKSWRGSRRQALRTLRKGLGSAQEGGNTGRRTDWPCHIKIADQGDIAETVRSAPGRDPRMARFIRILTALTRASRCDSNQKGGRKADVGGLTQEACAVSFGRNLRAQSVLFLRSAFKFAGKILKINDYFC
jgi:hypothetical protein